MKFGLSAAIGIASSLAGFAHADEAEAERVLFKFVGNYCFECHDSAVAKADRDFEPFEFPLKTEQDLITAKEIIDQITLKEMPPKEADQPSDDERLAVLAALREGMELARGKIQSTGARTVMRRLSNEEYENTLHTLFGRRIDTLGLTADFPKEKTSQHIDTIGASLITSGFLLDQYFQAANRLVEARLNRPATGPQTWHFTKNFQQYEELTGSHKSAFNFEFLCLYEQPNTDTRQGGYGHIEDFLKGVPVSGLYEIKVNATALHRFTHYDPAIFGIDFSEPFRLAVVPGDVTKGHIHYPQSVEPLLAEAIVPDDKFEWITFKVWLEGGQTPRFIFPNGPYESRASVVTINQKYKDEFKGDTGSSGVGRSHILKQGELPHIRIAEVKIQGPLKEEKGGEEEVAVFGPDGFQAEKALEQLNAFAKRAFRRPLTDHDKSQIAKTFQKRITEKATQRQAALDTLKMILCSPSFIYLAEITDEKETKLGAFDLASRLSYALWAAPPDEKLFAAAESGALKDEKALREQIARLLSDPRSDQFIRRFLDSWLNFRDIGNQPPPRAAARSYYAENLPDSMKREALLFFRNLLEKNGPVTDFIDSDYTFVDKKLAKLYDLPQKDALRLADGFRRVSIQSNPNRGGLLGMAGVLTVSANGVETSPVTRGVWISENIFGVTPPPPPDSVPPIDPDIRGAKTIREKLEKHRESKTCAECHRKIDPFGFPLEHFDPIGRYRSSYPKPKSDAPTPKIDPSGVFPSGEKFANFQEFKQKILSTRKEAFTAHLTSEFLSYATGRHMEPVDQFEIEDIRKAVAKEKDGLRTLIIESLCSDIFKSR